MSQKYPEGAIIVCKTFPLRKWTVEAAPGNVRFFKEKGLFFKENGLSDLWTRTVDWMEEEGWTVEETPWVPKEGEEYEFLDSKAQVCVTVNKLSYFDSQLIELGNCYKPGTGQAQAAAIRVKAAYKGEK